MNTLTETEERGLADQLCEAMAANRGELAPTEPHPAAYEAKAWIAKQPPEELLKWREAFASCAIEGNRLGEICAETLNRLLASQPVSDRYLLGLAWTMAYYAATAPEHCEPPRELACETACNPPRVC